MMNTLKEEEPFAFAAQTNMVSKICSFCFAFDKPVSKCTGCHVISYCDKACQKNDWVNHKKECLLLKAFGTDPGVTVRLVARILLKPESSHVQKSFNDRSWDSLEYLSLSASDEMSKGFLMIVNYIADFMKPLRNISRENIIKTFGKVQKHKRDIFDSHEAAIGLGVGVFLGFSIHKHSCIPNAQFIFSGTKAILRCFDRTRTKYSTDLTISYTGLPPYDLERKTAFKDKYFVDCTCEMCSDNNHIFNRMGSSCYVSCCEDGAGILGENSSRGPYRCNKCGKMSTLTVHDVKRAETKIIFNTLKMEDPSYTFNVKDVKRILHETGQVLSIYNFHAMHFLDKVFTAAKLELALNEETKKLIKHHCDKKLKTAKYYIDKMDIRMAITLLNRASWKLILDYLDGYDVQAAVDEAEHIFGEHHTSIIGFKFVLAAYQERNKQMREEQFRKAATNFNW